MAQQQTTVVQQQSYAGPNQQTIITTTTTSRPDAYPNYKGTHAVIIGAVVIVCAFLAIVFNVIGLLEWNNSTFWVLDAMWCGLWFFIAGGLAIGAGKSRSRCLVVAALVLAIIAAVFAFIVVCVSAATIKNEDRDIVYIFNYQSDNTISKAMGALKLICSLVIFIGLLWVSALSCAVLCGNGAKQNQPPPEAVVVYNNPPPQQAYTGPPQEPYPGQQQAYPGPPAYTGPPQQPMATASGQPEKY